MDVTDQLPMWLSALFPEVRDWRRVSPNHFRGLADPVHGNDFDHVLLVCDSGEQRYVVKRIADFAIGRTVIDLVEYSFRKLDQKLARDMEESR